MTKNEAIEFLRSNLGFGSPSDNFTIHIEYERYLQNVEELVEVLENDLEGELTISSCIGSLWVDLSDSMLKMVSVDEDTIKIAKAVYAILP